MKEFLLRLSIGRPRLVYLLTFLLVLVTGALMPRIHIDTDPENMLPVDQADRVFHNQVEEWFGLHDAIVVGVVNDGPDGVYTAETLAALHRVSRAILELDGVIRPDLMSLAEADNITQEGPGVLRFEWMMRDAPGTTAQAERIRDAVARLPLVEDTLVSGDGKAAAVYVPIERKDLSYAISREIEALVAEESAAGDWHITGLPVAEDTFGKEMFVQMGISAPLAGLMIFLLMWVFFRNLRLIISPMIVAMGTVIATMGLLIGMGFTVHIMSSMIPIFLMPIAVVDSIHILSEFADHYRQGDDPGKVMKKVVGHLFKPMLFTSLTSAAGFASLLLTPIPPVKVFGAFVAFGILLAFLLTIVFIPAWVVRSSPKSLASLDRLREGADADSALARMLRGVGRFAFSRSGLITTATIIIVAISVAGVLRIQINDNPVRWFKDSHRIRVADAVLNEHFAGTYDAFFVLTHEDPQAWGDFRRAADEALGGAVPPAIAGLLADAPATGELDARLGAIIAMADDLSFDTDDPLLAERLEALMRVAETAQVDARYFQRPEALARIEALQQALADTGLVGKTNALPDVVKVVNRELRSGDDGDYRIPATVPAVAQTLLQYQSSHRPQDLWHMVTPDFTRTAVWLQLTSGDNQDMTRVIEAVDEWLAANPLPENVQGRWAGKTYINVVWQGEMVAGMLDSLMGAFVVVFIMMVLLFRSIPWGIVAMMPLTFTIIGVYGFIGWIGKYYDMPIAVLSSLTLGLSVDFAIHFIQRSRELYRERGSFEAMATAMFEEPARAITRNAIVIALGFTPLFLAPLMPYVTVGGFMASIMVLSGAATLLLLPAVIALGRRVLFRNIKTQGVESHAH
ncbi:MAG: MMPL family transporter [Xanthomonadales bacterium]|nr:MMPL family transporter [Xanthomonadales bacterium]